MPKRVLILHAKESSARAQLFQNEIQNRGYIADCVGNLESTQTEGGYALMQQSIKDRDAVLILVSKGIFASCILSFGIGYALGTGKPLVSVVKDSDAVILPSWYTNLFTHGMYNEGEIWSKLKA